MTARSLVLLATWARAEWCAVQIANVFGDAPLSVEWRLDAAPDVVAAAAAAVVDELPASAWPAAVEAAVRSTMAAHRASGCAGSRRRGASSTPRPIAAAASRRISRPRRPTRRRISRRPSPWPARTATSACGGVGSSRRARGGGRRRAADAAEATARTSATVESEGVVVDAAWAERGRDLVVFSVRWRRGRARVPWASRERRHGAAAVAAAFARTADVGAACGAAARPRDGRARLSTSATCASGTVRTSAASARGLRGLRGDLARHATVAEALAGPRVAYADAAVAAAPRAPTEAQLAVAVDRFGAALRGFDAVVCARTDVLWADPSFRLASLAPSRDGVHARYDLVGPLDGALVVAVAAAAFDAPATLAELKAALGARGGAVDTAPLGAPSSRATTPPSDRARRADHNEAWLVHLVLAAKAPLCAAAGADISRLAFNRLAFAFGAGDDGALEVAPT
ncbi:hypothetical protein JL722_5222 [Aureococcus anophagefferens]|nr:hypothetical protein JL722_5222 [Aureococcus anophagefferens]